MVSVFENHHSKENRTDGAGRSTSTLRLGLGSEAVERLPEIKYLLCQLGAV